MARLAGCYGLLSDNISQQKFATMSAARYQPAHFDCLKMTFQVYTELNNSPTNTNYISFSHWNNIELVLFSPIPCCTECSGLSISTHVC